MMAWLDSFLRTQTVIWLFPVTFMLHDFEEIILVEPWLKKNYTKIENLIPFLMKPMMTKFFAITSYQFALTVAFEFIMLIPFTFMASEFGIYFFFAGINAIAFLHVFTHLGQSIMIKKYTPGVITGILITLPYSLYVFYRLLGDHLITWNKLLLSIPFGALVIPFLGIGHMISMKLLSGKQSGKDIEVD